MTRGRWTAAAVLLIIAVASRLLLQSASGPAADRLPEARSDYSLDNFDLLVMNELGEPGFTVRAPRLERVPEDGSARVKQPQVELYETGRVSWVVNANNAWISDDAGEIRLDGDVDLRAAPPDTTHVASDALVVFPDRQAVATDRPVRLERTNQTLEGTGLRARLDQDRWELMSDVKARFKPATN